MYGLVTESASQKLLHICLLCTVTDGSAPTRGVRHWDRSHGKRLVSIMPFDMNTQMLRSPETFLTIWEITR